MGSDPTSTAWKAVILAIVRLLHKMVCTYIVKPYLGSVFYNSQNTIVVFFYQFPYDAGNLVFSFTRWELLPELNWCYLREREVSWPLDQGAI